MVRAPRHVAIIMDGNGRWATMRRKARTYGHDRGVAAARIAAQTAAKEGVSELTLFGFSRENRQRPLREVETLKYLLSNALGDLGEFIRNGVSLKFVGDLDFFGDKLVENMHRAERETIAGKTMRLNVALNYGGQWDISQAVARLPDSIRKQDVGHLQQEISGRLLLGDVDLLIRTGGEARISNFLLWQIAYAEIYFVEALWPDFDAAAFKGALKWFARRRRKFGRTPAQLRSPKGS